MDIISLKAVEQGIMKIISNQGSVVDWSVLYTLDLTRAVLSPDHYYQSNISRYFTF